MATEGTLREFFSFAGPVGHVILSSDTQGGEQHGTVSFLTGAGAETALLLDGALIVDRPLLIRTLEAAATGTPPSLTTHPLAGGAPAAAAPTPAPANAAPLAAEETLSSSCAHAGAHAGAYAGAHAGAHADDDEVLEPPTEPPRAPPPPPEGTDGNRRFDHGSARSTISALLAAGFTLGQRALWYIQQAEEAYAPGTSRRAADMLRSGAESVQRTAQQIDAEHRIRERIRAFDEEHEISHKAAALWSEAVESTSAAVQTATPVAASAAQTVTSAATDAVHTARPIAASAAHAIREGAEQLSALARDDPNVGPALERGVAAARSGWAGVTSSLSGWWASAQQAAAARAANAPPPRGGTDADL